MKSFAITAPVVGGAVAAFAIGAGAGSASAPVNPCGSANGYDVSAEDSTTSCGFALNVARNAPAHVVTAASFAAYSPASGQTYQVNCERLYQLTLECTAGNGARVYLNSPN